MIVRNCPPGMHLSLAIMKQPFDLPEFLNTQQPSYGRNVDTFDPVTQKAAISDYPGTENDYALW